MKLYIIDDYMYYCVDWCLHSPRNPSLLGLNIGAGQEIRIRLRKPGRESEFLPYEALVGTMLHELTHNEHGPHDAKFYKLLDEITKVLACIVTLSDQYNVETWSLLMHLCM